MKASTVYQACILAAIVWCGAECARATPPGASSWVRQLGSSGSEGNCSVSADGLGSVYISGLTTGNFGGTTNAGGHDAFVAKYSSAGTFAWCRQLGTSSDEDMYSSVSADGLGNVYISGCTFGSLSGTNAGSGDAFLAKYNAAGSLAWCRQLGTSSYDVSNGVSTDKLGNVYISGVTGGDLGGASAGGWDTFISKYDASGSLVWSRQFGTSGGDYNTGVSADGLGNVYVTGYNDGVFTVKYDSSGNLVWSRQLGAGIDARAQKISADGLGNVFISGDTTGSLGGPNLGGYDAFVAKYNAAGSLAWCRQFGTSAYDESYALSADGLGSVYVSADTQGSLGGANAGDWDCALSKFDSTGSLLWSRQLGTSSDDYASGVSFDGLGRVYIAGHTFGNLGGPSAGRSDAFLAAFAVPEPPTFALLTAGIAAILAFVGRRSRYRWFAAREI
jgi:hypothetical protein